MARSKFRKASVGDKLSDMLLGTNRQAEIDAYNQETAQQTAAINNYELQRAVNMNKYSWNVQGMTKAGINPLAASGGVGQVAGGPQMGAASSPDLGGMGMVGDIIGEVKDLLHEVSPSTLIRDTKSLAKSVFHGAGRR